MALQDTYKLDEEVQGTDKLFGVDIESGDTVNFTINQIAQYFASTGDADGTRHGFHYTYEGEYSTDAQPASNGDLKLGFDADANSQGYSSVETIYVRTHDKNGKSILPISTFLQDSIITLANTAEVDNRGYALYRTTRVSTSNNVTALTVRYLNHAGNFVTSDVGLAVHQAGAIDVDISHFLSGAEAPDNTQGQDGDFYLDYENPLAPRLYGPKTVGEWGDGVDLVGPEPIISVESDTVNPDVNPSVDVSQEDENVTIEFDLPRAPTITIGEVNTVTPASSADVTNSGENGDIVLDFDLPKGDGGNHVTSVVQNPANPGKGVDSTLTFRDSDGTDLTGTVNLPSGTAGTDGTDGDGWTGGSYNNSTGVVTFTSDDGLGFTTGDLRGSAGAAGADGATILTGTSDPQSSDGKNGDYFFNSTSNEFFGPKANGAWPATGFDLEGDIGPAGPGYSNVSYDSSDGTITFTGSGGNSNYQSGDVRGDDGRTLLNGTSDPDDTNDGEDGDFYINTTNDTIFGPKTSGAWGTGTALSAALTVTEGDDSVSNVSTLAIVGDNVTLTQSGNTATLTFHGGGGGGVIPDAPSLTLTQSGFTANEFKNVTQDITFNSTVTKPDGSTWTYDSVAFSADNSEFTTVTDSDTTDDDFTSGQITGISFDQADETIVVRATLTYDGYGEDNETAYHDLTLQLDKTKPAEKTYLSSPTGFEHTPTNHEIEGYDEGSFTSATDTASQNGWTISAGTDSTLTGGTRSGNTITLGSSDHTTNLTFVRQGTITQTSPPSGETAIEEENFQLSNDQVYHRIYSLRTGSVASGTTFTASDIANLSNFADSASGDNRNYYYGDHSKSDLENEDGFLIRRAAGERFFIMIDKDLTINRSQTHDTQNVKILTDTTEWPDPVTVGEYKIYYAQTTGGAYTTADDYRIYFKID